MTTSERDRPSRWVVLVIMLALAAGLMGMPRRVTAPLRSGAMTVLRPGQSVTFQVAQWSRRTARWVQASRRADQEIGQLKDTISALHDQIRRLELHQTLEQPNPTATLAERTASPGVPLLVPRLLRANVLGEEASGFLQRQRYIALGTSAGVEPGTLVLDAPAPLLDQGAAEGVARGNLVLAGRAIIGRVVQTSPWASVVQVASDSSYRDLVWLAHPGPGGLRFGPQGVLHGAGGALCRVTMVEANHPVAVGDRVFSTRGQGVLPHPLRYGTVIHAEHKPGELHWDIRVQLAADLDQLRHVLVLRTTLNPARLAGRPERARR